MSTATQKVFARHFYLLLHYICNGLFFLFSVCWLHVNEFNSLWARLRGRRQKATAFTFIPSGAKTQKKEIMPYPRCGFGAGLRCG